MKRLFFSISCINFCSIKLNSQENVQECSESSTQDRKADLYFPLMIHTGERRERPGTSFALFVVFTNKIFEVHNSAVRRGGDC